MARGSRPESQPLTGPGRSIRCRIRASGPTTIALAADGTAWFTEGGQPDRPHRPRRDRPEGIPAAQPEQLAAHHRARVGRQHVVLGTTGNRMGRIAPDGTIAEFPIPTPNSMPRAIALGGDGNIWFGEFAGGKIGRITPQGVITEFPIPTPDSGPRALAAGPDGNIWFSEFNASKIGRITPDGKITEFDMPRPNSGPGDITAGADGNMWFLELNGQMDGRKVDGNRVGRITMDGKITEFQIPSHDRLADQHRGRSGSKHLVHQGGAVGRVTPDGAITEVPMPPRTAAGQG